MNDMKIQQEIKRILATSKRNELMTASDVLRSMTFRTELEAFYQSFAELVASGTVEELSNLHAIRRFYKLKI